MTRSITRALLLAGLTLYSCTGGKPVAEREKISLAGEWQFATDTSASGIMNRWFETDLPDKVNLPGTMDENGKGIPNYDTLETMRLSRELTYEGFAWYRKKITIPENWNGKNIRLIMERTKPSTIWIDTIKAGTLQNIMTPQVYDLSGKLAPGDHIITILVNNGNGSVPRGITGSHAWTEHTQTNWNGIIGNFCLEASEPDRIESVKVFPNTEQKVINIKLKLTNSGNTDKKFKVILRAETWNTEKEQNLPSNTYNAYLKPGVNEVEMKYKINGMQLWSEFETPLYRLSVILKDADGQDNVTTTFGMRQMAVKGTQFAINDVVTFLRGKHDGCVFPLTGHPPMDVEGWRKVFRMAKSYGINFYRFHSWTPPQAAFEAADIEGIYMQPELPFWGGFSKTRNLDLNEFLLREGDNILEEYGNHASFVMFALGNELSGDQNVMNDFLNHYRETDGRQLLAYGSNNYLGFRGQAPGEDYFAGCRIGADTDTTFSTHIRASFSFADAYDGGYINARYPSSSLTYAGALTKCTVPALGTEVGQYQIYPNYDEMKKYTGVLKPWNFAVFKKRIEEAGMADQAMDFFKASGALSAICYKADIEMAIRTPGFGGFHLLDLQDYPGQGSALIGLLDAFMESKGIISGEEFSQFCNSVVPLFIADKFCWSADEKLAGKIQVANYSDKRFDNQKVSWVLKATDGTIIAGEGVVKSIKPGGLADITTLEIPLDGIKKSEKAVLTIKLDGTIYENSYDQWIYPSEISTTIPENVTIATAPDKATLRKLSEGATVLMFPDHKAIQEISVGGLFIPDYWNYRMFKGISENNKKPVSPGTMTILTDPSHPLFRDFPTEFHSNWQWWAVVKNSRPFILDGTPQGYRPVVQVVDNIDRNHKLGIVFEFRVGKGKLLVCTADLSKVMDKPEARQFYSSLLRYASSAEFNPKASITGEGLFALFNSKASARKLSGVANISYQ